MWISHKPAHVQVWASRLIAPTTVLDTFKALLRNWEIQACVKLSTIKSSMQVILVQRSRAQDEIQIASTLGQRPLSGTQAWAFQGRLSDVIPRYWEHLPSSPPMWQSIALNHHVTLRRHVTQGSLHKGFQSAPGVPLTVLSPTDFDRALFLKRHDAQIH